MNPVRNSLRVGRTDRRPAVLTYGKFVVWQRRVCNATCAMHFALLLGDGVPCGLWCLEYCIQHLFTVGHLSEEYLKLSDLPSNL